MGTAPAVGPDSSHPLCLPIRTLGTMPAVRTPQAPRDSLSAPNRKLSLSCPPPNLYFFKEMFAIQKKTKVSVINSPVPSS